MIDIPDALLEQIERSNALLFIGERITRDAHGQAQIDHVTAALAARSGIADDEGGTFPEVAQAFEDQHGRQALIQFLRDQYEAASDEPLKPHHLIARLTECNVLVTTCIDRRLERAFDAAKRLIEPVTRDVDIAFEDERKTRLYKLRGSLDQAETLILTENDYEQFFDDQASISVVLRGFLARKTILFIGYDLGDANFKQFYRKVTAPLDNYARRAYAFGDALAPNVRRWCKRQGINVVEADAAAFLEALVGQLERRAKPKPATPALALLNGQQSAPLPEHPYKLLDYYEASDAAIFFGRERETLTLGSLIHAHRLVVVYGNSGVGKTSLLLAGVVPYLENAQPPYAALYVRAFDDPAQVIRDALERQLPNATLPKIGSLANFLAAATRALGRPLVIFLDQFEEFFIRLSPQIRAAFISELGALYDARDVPVKVVLSLREDWLAAMGEIEKRIPELFNIRQRLLPLTREEAHRAITAPVERLGVRYEPALVEQLLIDLVGSGGTDVMPPQLQLVCSSLFNSLGPGERTITLATYERLGGARGVLQKYLDDQLNRLGRDDRSLAHAMLEEMVTSQGTKAVKTTPELALALAVDAPTLTPVLEKLVKARLLRALQRDEGDPAYELAHEYLIREIGLSPEAQKRKEAEELVKQEVENWQRFRTLIAGDKLALIGDARKTLRLSDQAQALLLLSALQIGADVDMWLEQIGDPIRRVAVLSEASRSKLAVMRRRAATALGTQDMPESVQPLVTLATEDSDSAVRAAARAGLRKLKGQTDAAASRLRAQAAHADGAVRARAIEAFTALPVGSLPRVLAPRVLATRARLGATALAASSVATPARRAALGVMGLLAILIGLAYVFASNSYYISTKPGKSSGQLTLVVRRGQALLPLPGLNEVVADIGINADAVLQNRWEDVQRGTIWGVWEQNDDQGYRKWGGDLASTLAVTAELQTRWHLNRDARASALVSALRSPEAHRRAWAAQAIDQAIPLMPELTTPPITQTLPDLLNDSNSTVRGFAATALTRITTADPMQIAQALDSLVPLFKDQDYDVNRSAAKAWAHIVTANPKPDIQALDRLLSLLIEQDDHTRYSADLALDYVVKTDPGLSLNLFDGLRLLLEDQDSTVRSSAADSLRSVAAADPKLAAQVLNRLLPLLQDKAGTVRSSTAYSLGSVATADPKLATQVLDRLLPMLEDKSSTVPSSAIDALADVVKANPKLARQVFDRLLPMLNDQNQSSQTRSSAAYALASATEADPTLAEQMLNIAHALVKDEDSNMYYSAISALKSVATADPKLAAQVMDGSLSLLKHPVADVNEVADVLVRVSTAVQNSESARFKSWMELLVKKLRSSQDESRSALTRALAKSSAEHPRMVSPSVIQALTEVKDELGTDDWVRNATEAGILEDVLQALNRGDDLEPTLTQVVTVLAQDLSPANRTAAAQALFLLAINDDPRGARTERIRKALLPLSVSREPHIRIAASKSLDMLNVATIARKSAFGSPRQHDENEQTLRIIRESLEYGLPRGSLFDNDFKWIAVYAADWLDRHKIKYDGK